MPTIFLYLLKLSIGLSVVYLFYRLLLQRLTFYQANRWYLLAYPLVCCFIPLIDVAPLVSGTGQSNNMMVQYIPAVYHYMPVKISSATAAAAGIDGWQILWAAIAAGMAVLALRLLVQWLSFQRMLRQAVLLNSEGVKLYSVEGNVAPFSFANAIYLNAAAYSEAELAAIVKHEFVHVRQKHTVDIMLGELLCIVNWYNPFAWLLRHAMRQNLEYIADNAVLHSGTDKRAYQYLLLKVMGAPQFRIASAFNFSSLKKRIDMMNRIKTARVHLLKFLFVLPLVAALLLAFRDKAPLEKRYDAHGKLLGAVTPDSPTTEYRQALAASNAITGTNEHPSVAVSVKAPSENIYYINGMVLDAVTLEPLAGAEVKEEFSGLTAITGKNGYYSIALPINGKQLKRRCYISAAGYHTMMDDRIVAFSKSVPEKSGSLVFVGLSRNGIGGFVKDDDLPQKNGSLLTHPDAAALQQLYETAKANIADEREAAATTDTSQAGIAAPFLTPATLQQVFEQSPFPYHYINGTHYLVNDQGGYATVAGRVDRLLIKAGGVLYTGEALNKKYSKQQIGACRLHVLDAVAAAKAGHGAEVVIEFTIKE